MVDIFFIPESCSDDLDETGSCYLGIHFVASVFGGSVVEKGHCKKAKTLPIVKMSALRSLNGKCYGAVDFDETIEDGTIQMTPTTVDALPSNAVSEAPSEVSIQDMHRSVSVPGSEESWLSKLMAYSGPGALVAVGYMDPGNWTTDIGGGSAYNYDLLFVVLWSSLIALFFQLLSVKLAIATGKDLAQASKGYYPNYFNLTLWFAAEIAIIATDLAEVLGCAIAMQLLFGWRLEIGVLVTGADVALVFLTQVSQNYADDVTYIRSFIYRNRKTPRVVDEIYYRAAEFA